MKPAVFNSLYWSSFVLLVLGWGFAASLVIQAASLLLTVWLVLFFLAGARFAPLILRVLMTAGIALTILQVHINSTSTPRQLHVNSTLTPLFVLCCYTASLLKIRYNNYPLPTCKWVFIFISEAVTLAIFFYYLPTLVVVWPTVVFMIIASVTLQSAMHAFRLKEQPAGWLCLAGTALLILGNVLAIGHSGIAVLCYGLAGYGLVYGTTLYIWQQQGSPYISRQLGTN